MGEHYVEGTTVLPGGIASTVKEGYSPGVGIIRGSEDIDAARHSLLGLTARSPNQSWTSDLNIAVRYAGPNGKILSLETGLTNPDLISIRNLVTNNKLDYRALARSVGTSIGDPRFSYVLARNIENIDYNYEYLLRDVRVLPESLVYTIPAAPYYAETVLP